VKNDRSIITRIFSRILSLLTFLAVIWSAFCFTASIISPARISYLALFSLTTPFVLLFNAFLALCWLFTDKKIRFLVPVFTTLVFYKVFFSVLGISFGGGNNLTHGSNTLKLMHWNTHGLGLYSKAANKQQKIANSIVQLIQNEDPDILSIVECYKAKTDTILPFVQNLVNSNKYKQYFFNPDNTLGHTMFIGTAIFSKFPIDNFVVHRLGKESIYLIQADVHLNNKTFRFYSLHLYSFGLSDRDKAYIDSVKQAEHADMNHSRQFLLKFNNAYAARAKEADSVATIIKQSPYPVLLSGDFNDLPGSYTYATIRGDKLKDAFLDKGKGLGRTYNEISPTLRIDNILYDPNTFKTLGYRSPANKLSDHRAVIANFEIVN